MTNRSEPKVILFDIESLPDLKEILKVVSGISAYPGLSIKASINSIICFGYKIYGEKETKVINAWDFKGWKKNVNDDEELVKKIYDILKDADAVVTHNGKRFDWKFIQTRLLKYGMPPLHKIQHVDTCQELKKNLLLFNNRLNTAAKFMTSEEKMENGGWDLWVRTHDRHKKSMKLMSEYCAQDVITLEAIYKKILPFVTVLPNYNMFRTGEKVVCPNCGSTRLQKHGFKTTKTKVLQRFHCKDCGTSCSQQHESKDPKTL
jgi:DNA polymerase elongation subunit (family B)